MDSPYEPNTNTFSVKSDLSRSEAAPARIGCAPSRLHPITHKKRAVHSRQPSKPGDPLTLRRKRRIPAMNSCE